MVKIAHKISLYATGLEIHPEDFQRRFGRLPRDHTEFTEFCRLCEKDLLSGHIDWDIVFECTREAMG